MKSFKTIGAVLLVTALFLSVHTLQKQRHEILRLEQNQHALSTQVHHFKTRYHQEAASVEGLQLKLREFRKMHQDQAHHIQKLGIRLKQLEALSKSVTEQQISMKTALRDTIILKDSIIRHDTIVRHDTIRIFRWQDPHTQIEGHLDQDSVFCHIRSIDTLHQIVHRIPRRFLFFRWGTKALRQQIISSNPHVRIVYTEYIKIQK